MGTGEDTVIAIAKHELVKSRREARGRTLDAFNPSKRGPPSIASHFVAPDCLWCDRRQPSRSLPHGTDRRTSLGPAPRSPFGTELGQWKIIPIRGPQVSPDSPLQTQSQLPEVSGSAENIIRFDSAVGTREDLRLTRRKKELIVSLWLYNIIY
ncbi:Hypothetical protein CINCED_3A017276 [Cinara cedri]|uniref:Uncharacterized protein n=1 Tax=Cinara cedri TaxID=506608 RepID=A0A5E4MQ92_9HEMI|nr:Hypothetical protein CINCED_3A017276 [Cinara cedri]